MGVLQSIILSLGSSPLSIFLKKLFHIRNLPKSGNVVLLRSCCVCGVVVCPILEPLCFFFVNVHFKVARLHFKTVNITYTCVEDSATGC
jgi:hypothetical protein